MQVGYLESIQRYPIEHGEQLKFSVKSHLRSSFIRCPITSCSFRTSQQRPKPWTVHQPSKLDPKHSPVVPHENHHHGTHSKNHCDRTMFCSNLRIPKKHSYFHYSSIFESENTQKPFIGGIQFSAPHILLPNKKKHGPFSLVFGGNHANIISCLPSSFLDIFGCGCQKQLKSWELFK